MKTVNKLLALLLTLALLVSVPVVAFAEGEVADLFPQAEEILNSITTEETTGNGLAFLFELNVRGVAVKNGHRADLTNAVATVNGEDHAVVAMGAVMVNTAAEIAAALKMHEYRVGLYLKQARKTDPALLKRAVIAAEAADRALKRSAADGYGVIERLICSL